ncbi:MAG: hypothetical protein GOMPHAMPRED_004900 [Gomphillus americanus]|uniref:DUF6536 domain-containing protein n=1 Tax=Gomphillus americanus TaxID=1940652 RepID=A0A8H3ELL8_9LECA|nr:MAG: hypothetical protein GOMPHAMPRED_004900 [Gomphillus americanus]
MEDTSQHDVIRVYSTPEQVGANIELPIYSKHALYQSVPLNPDDTAKVRPTISQAPSAYYRHQQKSSVKKPGRFALKKRLLGGLIFLWLTSIAQLVLFLKLQVGEYGWITISEGPVTGAWTTYMLGFNTLSTIIILTSDFFRLNLLSPTTWDIDSYPSGMMVVGWQSLGNFMAVRWWKKILYIILGLTSLPIHLLYSSMIIEVESAFDAYEVVVSADFFHGKPFNISALNVTEFRDQPRAPITYGTEFPSAWPAIQNLQTTLEAVQRNTTNWNNLTEADCRSTYGDQVYKDFRTLPLAIGALPGQNIDGYSNKFMAPCPSAWLESTPGSFIPDTTPYISETVQDTKGCFKNNTFFESQECLDQDAFGKNYDMCYWYAPKISNPPQDAALNDGWDPSKAVGLSYCLSEPLSLGLERRIIVGRVAFIILCVLGAKVLAASISYLVITGRPIKRDDPKYTKHISDNNSSVLGFISWLLIVVATIVWACVLVASGLNQFGADVTPSSPADQNWIFRILIWANILHPLIAIRATIEGNFFDSMTDYSHWASSIVVALYYVLWHQFINWTFYVKVLERYSLESLAGSFVKAPLAILNLQYTRSEENHGGVVYFVIVMVMLASIFIPPILMRLTCCWTSKIESICWLCVRDFLWKYLTRPWRMLYGCFRSKSGRPEEKDSSQRERDVA